MLRGGRINLLIIPQEGSKTFELKIPRVIVALAAALILLAVVLLGLGFQAYFESRALRHLVADLQRDKTLLEAQVEQIDQLERILRRLQTSNRQLHAILGESVGLEARPERSRVSPDEQFYIPSVERLRIGAVQGLPTLWPARGVVAREFSDEFPATLIAVPPRALVRASGPGWVVSAGFDLELGHTVTLDHGHGLLTRYGYNRSLLVQAGDYVHKGQAIALSGRTGAATSPSVYYAVEEDGMPRDPQFLRLWL